MRVLLSGIIVAVALAVLSAFVLRAVQEPSHQAFSSSSVRVGDPGANLVGKSWSGDPRVGPEDRRTATVDSKAGAVD